MRRNILVKIHHVFTQLIWVNANVPVFASSVGIYFQAAMTKKFYQLFSRRDRRLWVCGPVRLLRSKYVYIQMDQQRYWGIAVAHWSAHPFQLTKSRSGAPMPMVETHLYFFYLSWLFPVFAVENSATAKALPCRESMATTALLPPGVYNIGTIASPALACCLYSIRTRFQKKFSGRISVAMKEKWRYHYPANIFFNPDSFGH